MEEECHFYHIPKTGGSSMNKVFIDSNLQIGLIHLVHKKRFMSAVNEMDILNETRPIFILFRNPIEQYMSSFYFFRRYNILLDRINGDWNLKNYAANENTYNQHVQFLTRPKIFDGDIVTKQDYETVKKFLQKPNVIAGTLNLSLIHI